MEPPMRRRRVYWSAGQWVVRLDWWNDEVDGPHLQERDGYGYETVSRNELLVFDTEQEALDAVDVWLEQIGDEGE